MEEEKVSKAEYDKHKYKCSSTFEEIIKEQQEQKKKIEEQNTAIFGTKDDPDDPGMKKMITEMYKFFGNGKISYKTIKYMLVGMVFFGGLIYTIIRIVKEIKGGIGS